MSRANRAEAVRLCMLAAGWSVLLGPPPPAPAQSGSGLDTAEAAADAGDISSARSLLGDWLASHPIDGTDREITRARFLRARLSADLDSAQVDYLWVAVQGGEPYAAPARLRLAQLRATRGELDRAIEDLDRLRADFPNTRWVISAWLWMGNIWAAAGDEQRACEAWRRALGEPPLADTAAELELASVALARCGPDGEGRTEETHFAVQLGAFRSREAALDLRNRAARTGVAARVVDPGPEGELYRVRAGRFASREEAARRAVELGGAGFEAIVVPEES